MWDRDWYVGLTCSERCAMDYILCRCDPVGVWSPAFNTANKLIGEKVDWKNLPEKVNGNIVVLKNGKWWVKDFCAFQYGAVKENAKSGVQKSIYALLIKHGLWACYLATVEPTVAPTVGLLLKEKEKEEEKKEKKELEITNDLYHRIEQAFLSKNDGKFSDYPKEGKCIHALIKKAKARHPEDPAALIHALLTAFWKLKQGDTSAKGFWRGQPFMPSSLSSLWDRVLETMRADTVDPGVLATINGGAA
jgi:hypothetical protein